MEIYCHFGPLKRASCDVDMVFCIDGTSSMSPVIDKVRQMALALPEDVLQEAKHQGKDIASLWIRLIVFRDYVSNGEHAMQMTEFFDHPAGKEALAEQLSAIRCLNGGDEPEDALEAIAHAMRSDWQPPRRGAMRRQVIIVWSDSSAHDIGYGRGLHTTTLLSPGISTS